MDAELTSLLDDLIAAASAAVDPALIRIWLTAPGDLCASCPLAMECEDRSVCLHLARSAGLSRRTDGPFRRFPLGAREVGQVATSLEPMARSGALAELGLADPAWLALHGIASFGAWPIPHRGRCVGVIAIFGRAPLSPQTVEAVASLARLAGAAIVAASDPAPRAGAPLPLARSAAVPRPAPPPASMADTQRAAILSALERAGGRVSGRGGAAELLAMKPTTLESRMRRLGIRKPPRPPVTRETPAPR